MKILLVEDRLDLANNLAEEFKGLKYKIITKSSSLGALEFLENNRVDILISDLHMDHINGEQLAQIVRKKYSTPSILMSGDYNIKNSKNFDAFILKPFNFDELVELVKIVAQKSKKTRPQSML